MKILIPEHIPQEIIEKIKGISEEIEVLSLKIIEKENIIRKFLRKIASCILSYKVYKKLDFIYRTKKGYTFSVGNEKLNGLLKDTKVFLASWVINKDMFSILLNYLPNLEWVHSTKTGIDHLTDHRLRERNILLTNSQGIHSQRIAEFVTACIFEVSKHISKHIALKQKGKWEELQSTELKGKVIGILGTGSIGTAIAEKAKALGMKTIGYNRTVEWNPYFNKILGRNQLSEVLKVSDFMVICLTSTQETEGLIGENELAMMKPSSYIINVARSEIIREEALIHILKQKKIAGAILDVVSSEMQLPNHPFCKLDNVLLSHYSAHSSENSNQEIFELFLENLKNFIVHKELTNVISIKE